MICKFLKSIFSKKEPSVLVPCPKADKAYREAENIFLLEKPLVGVLCASMWDYEEFCAYQKLQPRKFGYRYNGDYRFRPIEINRPYFGWVVEYLISTQLARRQKDFKEKLGNVASGLPLDKVRNYLRESTCPHGLEAYSLVGEDVNR